MSIPLANHTSTSPYGTPPPADRFIPIQNALNEDEILWLENVRFHSKSGARENRVSLQELAKTKHETENPLLKEVMAAIDKAATTQFTELKDLADKSRMVLLSVGRSSPIIWSCRTPT